MFMRFLWLPDKDLERKPGNEWGQDENEGDQGPKIVLGLNEVDS
jgi:hypothetical protein